MPFVDVVTNDDTTEPAHIVEFSPKLNVGVMNGEIVTTNDVVVAHCPASGVNV